MTPLKAAVERAKSYLNVYEIARALDDGEPGTGFVTLPIADLRLILAALAEREWRPIETAPRGSVSDHVGCRGESEWFSALVVRTGAVHTVRRRAWPQGDHWQDKNGTIYSAAYFDLWQPLPDGPEQPGERGE